MLKIDPITRVAYDAGVTASAKAQAVLSSLVDPVTVNVYDGNGVVMGSGTMATPWATVVDNVLRMSGVSSFEVTSTGTPDSSWTIKFESGDRWLTGSFGLAGSGQEFIWSLPTWEQGQFGRLSTATAATWKGVAQKDVADWFSISEGNEIVFGWKTLDTKSLGTIMEGNTLTYSTAQDADIPPTSIPEYTIVSTPVLGISIDSTSGVLSVSNNVLVGDYNIDVDLVDTVDPEQDWLNRAQSPGVVFAHDFRTEDELRKFLRVSDSNIDVTANKPTIKPNAFGQSGAIVSRILGTRLMQPVTGGLDAYGREEIWEIENGSGWPVAVLTDVNTHYRSNGSGGASGQLMVSNDEYVVGIEGPWEQDGKWYIKVRRGTGSSSSTTPRDWPIGTLFGSKTAGDWDRPLCAFPAGTNGKTVNDRGWDTGDGKCNVASWNRTSTSSGHANFRSGYWAHPSVGIPGQSWVCDRGTITNAFAGDEFYIQWMMRFPNNTLQLSATHSPKIWYLQTADESSIQQLYGMIGGLDPKQALTPEQQVYGANQTEFGLVYNGQTSTSRVLGIPYRTGTNGSTGQDQQYGNTAGYSCIRGQTGMTCWNYPPNTWINMMLHIKVGGPNHRTFISPLVNDLPFRAAGTQPVEDIEVVDGSGFPDPAVTGATHHIMIESRSVQPGSTTLYGEVMQLLAKNGNILTVKRNIDKSHSSAMYTWWGVNSPNYKLNDTASYRGVIAYGIGGDTTDQYGYPWRWMEDPLLSPNKNMNIEVLVAVEGETSYTKIMDITDLPWKFGDNTAYGSHSKNPPAFNSFRPTLYQNFYVGGSGAGAAAETMEVEYTQIILSKNPVPCPQVWPT